MDASWKSEWATQFRSSALNADKFKATTGGRNVVEEESRAVTRTAKRKNAS